ncbi:serine hydrolase domain-containing protein [Rhizobium sp. LEGMi135b]
MLSVFDDEWGIASPAEVGLDVTLTGGLDRFVRQWPKHNVHAVLVARRGKLVFESYFRGKERRWMDDWSNVVEFSPTHKHDIRSISKSVTSLLVGIAIDDKAFPPLDSPVLDCFPEYADLRTAAKSRITFRHLLTMTHGLRWEEYVSWKSRGNSERQLLESSDPCRYALKQRVAHPPGILFNYSGGATTILGAALSKSVDKSLEVYASEKLFEPLAIKDVEWLRFPNADLATAFAGLRLRPRDLAKFGQLMLDKGRWNGRQIIPSKWISESMQPYANTERHGALFYGYHWWLGRSLLKGRELRWVAGFGAGGQRLFVLPELDLVVVVNAFNYTDPVSISILNGFVLPAIRDDLF